MRVLFSLYSLRHFFFFGMVLLLLGAFTIPQAMTATSVPLGGPTPIRPLDYIVTITGTHTIGDVVEFTHNLGPDPASLHPVWVYGEDANTLWGLGKYAVPFGPNGIHTNLFGDGRDGPLLVQSTFTFEPNDANAYGFEDSIFLTLTNQSVDFVVTTGDRVLIHQTRGTDAGRWQINRVVSYDEDHEVVTLETPLTFTAVHSSIDIERDKAQLIVIPQYTNVTINSGGQFVAKPWNGFKGGILVFFANGIVTVEGTINVAGVDGTRRTSPGTVPGAEGGGFRGGFGHQSVSNIVLPQTGEGSTGDRISVDGMASTANGNGGGASNFANSDIARSAGGGGHSTVGIRGTHGNPGGTVGNATLTSMNFGGGGGGGGRGENEGDGVGSGGSGGGIVAIFAEHLLMDNGVITSNGGNAGLDNNATGQGNEGGGASGGAGAGGSILLKVGSGTLGTNQVTAIGGIGTSALPTHNGSGGIGRVRVESCETPIGTTNPAPNPALLKCYIIEQVESPPYNYTSFILPESFLDTQTYNIRYGRRIVFESDDELLIRLRVPVGAWTNATFEAMLSNFTAGPIAFQIDIGDDGPWDWTYNGNLDAATVLPSSNLASAFTEYWQEQGSPQSGTLDVPVRVGFNTEGQVLLSNLQMVPVVAPSTATPSQTNTPINSPSPTVTLTVTPGPSPTPTSDGEIFIPVVLRQYAFATPPPAPPTPTPTATPSIVTEIFKGNLTCPSNDPNNEVDYHPYPPRGTGTGVYSGTLSRTFGDLQFRLVLLQYTFPSGPYIQVAPPTGSSDMTTITYPGTAGTYQWRVDCLSGSGTYQLIITRPPYTQTEE